jgi:pimeloyl-ACP methyl ester carboxylesterase
MTVAYRHAVAGGIRIFYREAGRADAPALLLLHGFPTSSHMFRDLIPLLADRFRVIAPDLPGFGFSDAPDADRFTYTFDRLAEVMDAFTDAVGLSRYALYFFDYGAPVGFRLALKHPERIAAIISQNGNAYLEGLRRLVSDKGLLAGADGGKSLCTALLPHAGNDKMAVRPRRQRREPGRAGILHPRRGAARAPRQ